MTDDPIAPTSEKPPGAAGRTVVFIVLILLLVGGGLAHRASQQPVHRLKRQLADKARLLDWQLDALRTADPGPSQLYWARESERTQQEIDALKASIAEAEGRR